MGSRFEAPLVETGCSGQGFGYAKSVGQVRPPTGGVHANLRLASSAGGSDWCDESIPHPGETRLAEASMIRR
jgi:hypothetical protein